MLSSKRQSLLVLLVLLFVFLLGLFIGHLTFSPISRYVQKQKLEKQAQQSKEERINTFLNNPVPSIASTTSDGEPWRLSNQKGNIVVLHFWSSSCPACHEQISAVKDLYNDHSAEEEFSMVGVCLDFNQDLINCLNEAYNLSWIQLFDLHKGAEGSLAAEFQIRSIPSIWIIDQEGIVRGMDLTVSEARTVLTNIMSQI